MPKMDPVLLNQNSKPFNSSVKRIKHNSSQSTKLGSSIPSIAAVDQYVDSFLEIQCNLQRAIQYQKDEIVPLRIRQWRKELIVVSKNSFDHLVVGLSNCMYVGNVEEFYLTISVVFGWLIPFSGNLIPQGCHVSSSIVNDTIHFL